MKINNGVYNFTIDNKTVFVKWIGRVNEKTIILNFQNELTRVYNNFKQYFSEKKLKNEWTFFTSEESPIYLVQSAPYFINKYLNIYNRKDIEKSFIAYPAITIFTENDKIKATSFFSNITRSAFLLMNKHIMGAGFSGYFTISMVQYLTYSVLTDGIDRNNYCDYYSLFVKSFNDIEMDNGNTDFNNYVYISSSDDWSINTNEKVKQIDIKSYKEEPAPRKSKHSSSIFPGFYIFLYLNSNSNKKFSSFVKKINKVDIKEKGKKIVKLKKLMNKHFGKGSAELFTSYNGFWKENKARLWKIIIKSTSRNAVK
ncbi:MAG: hypothetical protein ACTSXH_15885 [Promethearchaeota archaeon]